MDGVSNPSHAQTIEQEDLPKLQGQNDTGFANNFKTISNTHYNPHNSQGQSSFRDDGSGEREVNSQLERHRYERRKGGSKKHRKFGNKTIKDNGSSFDGGSMNAYVPASICYGVNHSNRKANRHFFGMGNNLIVGGSLPYAADMSKFGYAPPLGGMMNNTHNGFSP